MSGAAGKAETGRERFEGHTPGAELYEDDDDYRPFEISCKACNGTGIAVEGWDCEECDGIGYWEI